MRIRSSSSPRCASGNCQDSRVGGVSRASGCNCIVVLMRAANQMTHRLRRAAAIPSITFISVSTLRKCREVSSSSPRHSKRGASTMRSGHRVPSQPRAAMGEPWLRCSCSCKRSSSHWTSCERTERACAAPVRIEARPHQFAWAGLSRSCRQVRATQRTHHVVLKLGLTLWLCLRRPQSLPTCMPRSPHPASPRRCRLLRR